VRRVGRVRPALTEVPIACQPTVSPLVPDPSAKPMKRALVVLCTLYASTLVALYWVGIQPAVPWSLLPLLALVVMPFALGATGAVALVAGHARPERAMTRGRCILLGAMFLFAYRLDSTLFLLGHVLLLPIVLRSIWRSGLVRPLSLVTGVLAVGYASIWNLNYLAALLSRGRVADPVVKRLDVALYQLIVSVPIDYVGFFPVVRSELFFHVLENAYLMLLPEIFVVAWLWVMAKRDLIVFFRTFFACYLIALVVFAIYPVVGPCIYFSESFHPDFRGTLTFRLMDGMAAEYTAALQRTSVNGFGYFIAIPSLHVALAFVLQAMLRFSPGHFWAFLPINVALALSTVLLGYHYVIDAVAGVALGTLVTIPGWRRNQDRQLQDDACLAVAGQAATSSSARGRFVRE